MGRLALVAAAALVLAAPALAADPTPKPLPAPSLQPPNPRLTKADATRIFLQDRKVASWLRRYPEKGRTKDATYAKGSWKVSVWWGTAGEIATGRVDDTSGA
ncbi:MAG: hypothetical protein ACXVFC_05790, partial [Gaiellaceae bacterium]